MEHLNNALSAIQGAIDEFRAERDEAQGKVSDLERDLSAERDASHQREAALVQANEKLMNRVEELSQTISSLQSQVMELTRSQNDQFRALASSQVPNTPDVSRSVSRGPRSSAVSSALRTNVLDISAVAAPEQHVGERKSSSRVSSPGAESMQLSSSSAFVMPLHGTRPLPPSLPLPRAASRGPAAQPQASPSKADSVLAELDRSVESMRAGAAQDVAAYRARLAAKLRGEVAPGPTTAVAGRAGEALTQTLELQARSGMDPAEVTESARAAVARNLAFLPQSARPLSATARAESAARDRGRAGSLGDSLGGTGSSAFHSSPDDVSHSTMRMSPVADIGGPSHGGQAAVTVVATRGRSGAQDKAELVNTQPARGRTSSAGSASSRLAGQAARPSVAAASKAATVALRSGSGAVGAAQEGYARKGTALAPVPAPHGSDPTHDVDQLGEVRPEVRAGPYAYDSDRPGGQGGLGPVATWAQPDADESVPVAVAGGGAGKGGKGGARAVSAVKGDKAAPAPASAVPTRPKASSASASGQATAQAAAGNGRSASPAPGASVPAMTAPQFFALLRTSVQPASLETLMAGLTLFNKGSIGKGELMQIAEKSLGSKEAQKAGSESQADLVGMFKTLILRV